jgi:hypothetical protein
MLWEGALLLFNFSYWLALEGWIQGFFFILGRIISLAKASGFQEGVFFFPIPLFSCFSNN